MIQHIRGTILSKTYKVCMVQNLEQPFSVLTLTDPGTISQYANVGQTWHFYYEEKGKLSIITQISAVRLEEHLVRVPICTSCGQVEITDSKQPCECDYCPHCLTPAYVVCPTCEFHRPWAGEPLRKLTYVARKDNEWICAALDGKPLCGFDSSETTPAEDLDNVFCLDCRSVLGELSTVVKEMIEFDWKPSGKPGRKGF